MAYAKTTKVPVRQTKGEIERYIENYGAENFGIMRRGTEHVIAFTMNGLNILFTTQLRDDPQEERANWRALAMCIKMKLEAVEAGIETFEEAFLSHVVAPDGLTYGQHVIPKIGSDYQERRVPMLPDFSKDT